MDDIVYTPRLKQQHAQMLLSSITFFATSWGQEAYVYAQYFFSLFLYLLVGLSPQSGSYSGPTGIFGDGGAGHAGASGKWLLC